MSKNYLNCFLQQNCTWSFFFKFVCKEYGLLYNLFFPKKIQGAKISGRSQNCPCQCSFVDDFKKHQCKRVLSQKKIVPFMQKSPKTVITFQFYFITEILICHTIYNFYKLNQKKISNLFFVCLPRQYDFQENFYAVHNQFNHTFFLKNLLS